MRHFNESYPMVGQMASLTSPLILIRGEEITFFTKEQEKVEAFLTRTPGDKFIMPIPGKFRTDVFEIQENDILILFGNNTDEK